MNVDITNHLIPWTQVKRMIQEAEAKAWVEGFQALYDLGPYQTDFGPYPPNPYEPNAGPYVPRPGGPWEA